MSLAKKMYLTESDLVPCVNPPKDLDLGDIRSEARSFAEAKSLVLSGSAKSMFVFVHSAAELEKQLADLEELWGKGKSFWVFYPKASALPTDLSRDKTWKLMRQVGMMGTRQVAVGESWSCMYFKNSGKSDYVEILAD